MKPPFCWLCGRDFRSEWLHKQSGGELVRFRDYEPLPEGAIGQAKGVEWFCRDHTLAARSLTNLDSSSALVELQRQFGAFPKVAEPDLIREPSLWVIAVGTHTAKVLALIQQATDLPAIEALPLLRSVPFELVRGCPRSFEGWRIALENAGAQVEVRYD